MMEKPTDYTRQYKPISAWGYVGYTFLFLIPIVGFICLIVFSFSDKNINRRNYARSYWAGLLVGCIFLLLPILLGGSLQLGRVNSTSMTKTWKNDILSIVGKNDAKEEASSTKAIKAPKATEAPAQEAVAKETEAETERTLSKGSKGEEVKELQQRLKELGYLSGSANGSYGNATEKAVMAFQKQNGLEETGVADEETREEIFYTYAEPAATKAPNPTKAPDPTKAPKAEKESSSSSSVTPSFKKTMDDYEAFFDDYVDLLTSLEKNPSDLQLMAKSATMLGKYAAVMDDLEKLEEKEMSAADEAYFVKVMARIDKKLAKIAALGY